MKQRVAIMVGCLSGGGMERVAAQLSVILSNLGFEVYILVHALNKRNVYEYKGKVNIFPYAFFNESKGTIREKALLLHDIYLLTKFKQKNQIDFTVSFAPEMNLLNMLSGVKDKKILTIHSCLSVRQDFNGFCYHKLFFKLYNYSYKVVAVSKWCKQDLINHYGIKENKIEVIYNPINFRSVHESVSLKENVILVVGRLHDVKQQWHIIRAFKKVVNELTDAKLIIAGIGENGRYLRTLVKQMDMETHVVFKGFVNKIDELYKRAKIVAFSSASEAFPCSVIEAISNGVPVIAGDCPGGIREIIAYENSCDNIIKNYTFVKCGILVPKFNGKKYHADVPLTKAELEMAKGILYLLKNESVRQNLVKNCLMHSRQFDEKEIEKQWKKLMRGKL